MEQGSNSQVLTIPSPASGKRKLSFPKFKRFIFLTTYISAVPLFIFFLILFSLYTKYDGVTGNISQTSNLKYQAIPTDNSSSFATVENSDARVKALDDFFQSYNSPLQGHAQEIVSQADKYNIDYRLLPAIAMQESTLCKKIIKDSYNCWGFGIYHNKVTKFDNYDQAIDVVTSTLAHKYVQQGYVSIADIVSKYNPNDTGRWQEVVSMIMTKLQKSL